MKSRVWKYLEKEILVNKKTEQSETEILEAKFEKQQMEKIKVSTRVRELRMKDNG